ncbi:hypothetical protein JHK87_024482 [Glycine soja]|nr:hypothetical protein JHK87_024482 [Glycine soja]
MRCAVLRLHFYGDDEHCIALLKAWVMLEDSVSRVEEDEEDLDPSIRHKCMAEPTKLGSVESTVLKRVQEEFGTAK